MKKEEAANGLHFSRKNGYVYIARGYKGFIKVGAAHNVENRLRQLRRKDNTIKLVACIRSERYMYLEKFLHLELSEYKVANEWYKNELAVIAIIVKFMISHGIIFGAGEVFFTAPSSQ